MILWIILGWWLCRKYLCNTTPDTTAAVAPVVAPGNDCNTFRIADNGFNVNTSGNVNFLRSDHSHLSSASILNVMNQVANYLTNNATRGLEITGHYDTTETNSNSAFGNLGLSRAEDVKAWLVGLGAPSSQITTTSSVSGSCFDNNTLRRGVAFDFSGI